MEAVEESKGQRGTRGRGKRGGARGGHADTQDRPRTERGRGDRGRGDRGRGDRGRGGRGFGRGGKKPQEDHEETKGDHKENRRGGDNRRKGKAPKDAPKDSFFYKFHYGPWPENKNIEVTIDSELPEQIPKDQRLQEPTKEEYIKNMQHYDDKIKQCIEKIKNINKDKEQVYKRGVEESKARMEAEGVKDEPGKSFSDLVKERNGHIDKKKTYDAQVKEEKDKLDKINADFAAMTKQTKGDYKTVKAVTDRIETIERTIQTETITPKQEKEYYKEISNLKKSIKYVEKAEKNAPEREKLKTSIKSLEKKAKEHRKEINRLNTLLDVKAEENKKRKEISGEKKVELDALEEKVQKVKAEIKEIEIQKDEARELYYKKKYEYECQKSQVQHIDRLHKRKNDLIKAEEERKKHEEEKRAERDAMPNPYEDDISTCDFLIRYCKKLLKDREQKDTKTHKDTERKEESAKKSEQFLKQAEEGKIQFIKPKNEREKEELIVIGDEGAKGKKKKSKKKPAKPVKTEENRAPRDPNELSFNYEIIQNFGEVGVNPPDTVQDLEKKVEELENKRRELFEKGEKKLDEQLTRDFADEGHKEDKADKKQTQKLKEFTVTENDEENWPSIA